ncbi:protease [Oceanidesulfovibrio indonesiensis]|uniref:Protease n=1 Tax=Oceanidesulfovibrio indonesiensis TaxID=54767 RepID=A0A7M3MGE4_9BACT|nr:type 1 glutamine amidotransferase domain-containing protein [Oceanidesulfovibrio indonesiensis]TVM17942.1 protease [Oceanidesulfovibrio indonesiensis]
MSELTGKKIVLLVADHHNDYEFVYPYFRMKEAGAAVTLAGPEKDGVYKGKYGMPAKADLSYDELDPTDFDGVIIPGGYAPDVIRRYEAANEFVKEMFETGKTVAYICHAGWVPASAGILEGKRCTSFFAIRDDLVNAGAQWVDEEVVVDGNLISSRTPDDLPAFCKAIIQNMQQ